MAAAIIDEPVLGPVPGMTDAVRVVDELLAHVGSRGRGIPGSIMTRMSASPASALVIDEVRKSYGSLQALKGVSFGIERGEFFGLLGPNGAGKTTVLRMLMGLIAPTSGQMRAFGSPIRPGAAVLSRIGAFVEGPGFLPHLSGAENLRLYWEATGRPVEQARMAETLEIAGLGDSVHRKVGTYSQGMRQRLAIAQAMLGLPELLILDEPTNGLDPAGTREIRTIVAELRAGGATVLLSSHLLSEVEAVCTHVAVLKQGTLLATGPLDRLLGAADGDWEIATTDPAAALRELGAAGADARAEGAAVVLAADADGPRLFAGLVGAGVAVHGLARRRTGLEELFTRITEGDA